MKTIHTILVLLICISNLFAQREKVNTYALIVGISDYNDERIPDLTYAHADAKAFADYLKSPAGGSISNENITLLTESAATNGAISDALYKLSKKVKSKDRVFFYFAGHGDVENDTIYNLGFLLAWDTPFNCYRNNALSLEQLNREAARMSINKNAEVVYILDACHAAELAGEANQGKRLANKQMRKRKAREVRIMSCESDQESLEHSQIGGGRGIFSYHLIRGLTGLAKKEGSNDSNVTAKDLRNYLEEMVPDHAQAFDHVQNPIVEAGDRKFRLAVVNEEALTALLDESTSGDKPMVTSIADINTRSIKSNRSNIASHNRNLVNAIKDSEVYLQIGFSEKLNLNSNQFYTFIFEQLKLSPYKEKLSSSQKASLKYFQNKGQSQINNAEWLESMRQSMAITLNDLAQQAINNYLQANAEELKKRNITNSGKDLQIYPNLMAKAVDLLDESHPLHKSLKIKYHYFNGVAKRLQIINEATVEAQQTKLEEATIEQQKALALDDKAPYIFNEIGILHSLRKDKKAAEKNYLKALELAPTWAIPYSNLCGIYNSFNQLDKAKLYADSAIALSPKYPLTYNNLGKNYQLRNNYLKAESQYRKAMELAPSNYVSYEQLAFLYLATNEYSMAEEFFIESDKRKGIYVEVLDPGNQIPLYSDSDGDAVYTAVLSAENYASEEDCEKHVNQRLDSLLQINPNDIELYFEYALFQEEQGCRKAAAEYYQKIIDIDDKHISANMALALYYYDTYKNQEAVNLYEKIITLDPEIFIAYKNLANIIHLRFGNTDEAINLYYKAIALERKDEEVLKTLANIFFTKAQHETAEIFYSQLRENEYYLDDNTRMEMADNFMQWGHETEAEFHYKSFIIESAGSNNSYFAHTAYNSLLHIFMRQERYKEAEAILIKIKSISELNYFYQDRVNQFPEDLSWFYLLTQLEYQNNIATPEVSIERYEKLIQVKPNHESLTDIYVNLGKLYYDFNKLQKSTEFYELAIARDTSNANTYLKIADAYLKVFQKEKAFAYLEQMYDRQMIDINNRLVYVELLTLAGRYKEAEKVVKVAEEIYPFEWSEIYKKRANLYMISKDMKKAIAANQKILDLNEYRYQSYSAYNLASIYSVNEEYDTALSYLEKAFNNGFKYRLVLKYDPAIRILKENRTAQVNALLLAYSLE